MAAQPIVREGYKDPAVTYDTNVMGTVNILEAVRKTDSVRSFLNVTTDKVYRNMEWEYGYRETDVLGGFDPYSCSKSCSELITDSYRDCFLKERGMAVSSARAGNVIGGGDFAPDRIIPDCIRAALKGKVIDIRNPFSVRPYQHVLDPVCAYLLIAAMQYKDIRYASSYNIGPDEGGCISTGQLADLFVSEWGDNVSWRAGIKDGPHESCLLRLDCSRMKAVFGWKPVWTVEEAVRKTVEMTRCIRDHGDVRSCMEKQIQEFFLCQIM
jgi:CDP-glucose 4,6-dehydratase